MFGTCETFCPDKEAKLRTREKLLHFYEYKNGQKQVPGILVKCFSRSAAGVKKPHPNDMRTERCLQKTIEYLFKEFNDFKCSVNNPILGLYLLGEALIILDKRKSFNVAYDFIFDRLRAIRQEIVIQNYDARQTIKLLEPMIMFLAYSRYSLCEESIDNFDPKICEQHLQECLKRVLCCYDSEVDNSSQWNLSQQRNRNFIEALYQIFNLGAPEALKRGLTLPLDTREDKVFSMAFGIAMNYHRGNLYRVAVGLTHLPHILCAIGSLKMQQIRRKLLVIFSHAYNSKQLSVSVDFVSRLMQCSNKQDLFDICKYYNIHFTNDRKGVQFIKADFNANIEPLKPRHELFVEQKMQKIYLPEVLLLRKL